MIIRLGYIGLSKTLDITCSRTISYTNFLKLNEVKRKEKIHDLIISNLTNLEKLIDYNIKNNIHFFRITSNLIPLATLKDIKFNYINPYLKYYHRIVEKINKSHMRLDFHPSEFTVLNSTKKEVVSNTLEILEYHYNLLSVLGIKHPIMVLHIGSSVLGKDNSMKRFINNFNKLPDYIKKCIALENDDKIYNVVDTLEVCRKIGIPMVLDYHHHVCNKENIDINGYYEEIFKTWHSINPKIHFSSPKSKLKKEFRSHHDYINVDDFIAFIESIKHLNFNIDIMIEAKEKDNALFKLVRELKYKTNYKFLDETSFEV